MVSLSHYLLLSAILFLIGGVGVLIRKNMLIVLMSLEIMFNAVNLTLVAFSHHLQSMVGRTFAVFTITIAAAEVAVGLAIMVALFRVKKSVNVDEANIMRG